MPLKPLLDPAAAAANMAEIEPAYTPQQAKVEADRCLYCFDAPCITACPTGIDIPAFIKKIASDNLTGAGRTILEANVLEAAVHASVRPRSSARERVFYSTVMSNRSRSVACNAMPRTMSSSTRLMCSNPLQRRAASEWRLLVQDQPA